MQLALITPVAHLEWTKLLPGRFCIATMAARDVGYLHYFANESQAGYQVVLDNGIFEGERLSDKDYLEIAASIKPSVVVAPDTIGADASRNWAAACHFVEAVDVADLGNPPEVMFVPQCERDDLAGFIGTLTKGITDARFKWVGICRDAVYNAFGQFTRTTDQELNRFYFSAWAQQAGLVEMSWAHEKRFHFLGVGSKLWMLQHYWFVDRMDTASLFYQATLGNVESGGILADEVKRPSDYFQRDFEPESDWSDLLQWNCKCALEYASKAGRLRRKIEGDRL